MSPIPDDAPDEVREKLGDGPVLNVTFERALCNRHGEPFRSEWPSGFGVFLVKGVQKLNLIGQALAGLPLNQAVAWAELELDKKPVCCRFKREELLALYLDAKKWKRRLCVGCKSLRDGAPYRVRTPEGAFQELRHVCLWCVLWRMEPHENAPDEERKRFEDEENQERGS